MITLQRAMPTLKAIAAYYQIPVANAKVIQHYRNQQAKIHPFISTNVGIGYEIAASAETNNPIRQSILN